MLKIFVICIIIKIGSTAFDELVDPFKSQIAGATLKVIELFYLNASNTLQITRTAMENRTYIEQSGMLNEILYSIHSRIVFSVEDPQRTAVPSFNRFFNIIMIDGYSAFE